MEYRQEYQRWLRNVIDTELLEELNSMDDRQMEDAFFCDLFFGTGGIRGILGAGTNRMNVYVVAKVSQGLANYLSNYLSPGSSVVIGYDSRIKSDLFANVAASVFAANGITVHIWSELLPVSTVSYAVRSLHASAGVMITASHNPSNYNGYKVYSADGCQITTKIAEDIFNEIGKVDIFSDVCISSFQDGLKEGKIKYISSDVLTAFIEEVKRQSVLFGDHIDRDIPIVYSPLNGTGFKPVTRVLQESGFNNITIVEEQRNPDGNFPTCRFPNPEIRETMELGLEYCRRVNAHLLIVTDPDCDRCGIAVHSISGYQLLSGNEVGLLLLDYVCSQRRKHGKMPAHPIFVKTIVTIDLAEKIADHYGVKTINVLTGFKFIGEVIGKIRDEEDYICGFEESYGYLTGSYVRDKDAVNATFMICEMFAFYKTRGVSLLEKLEEIYSTYGYCMNTLYTYEFDGPIGMRRIIEVMEGFRKGLKNVGKEKIVHIEDYNLGLNGLPKSNVLKFVLECASIVIRPSGTEPKLKIYVSVTARNKKEAKIIEKRIIDDLESLITTFRIK